MNDEDQKMLEMYLKDRRKYCIIVVLLVIIISFIGCYISYSVQHKTDEQICLSNNIINKIIYNEIYEVPLEIEEEKDNTIKIQEEKSIKTQDKHTSYETKKKSTVNTNKKQDKEFLFVDGYTMENVSEVAQQYLKSSGGVGKCIPIKDEDGVCIGMKVVFD